MELLYGADFANEVKNLGGFNGYTIRVRRLIIRHRDTISINSEITEVYRQGNTIEFTTRTNDVYTMGTRDMIEVSFNRRG